MKDVRKVPRFLVYEDPDTIDGESWTIQCEVLQHKPQGEVPPVEDPLPENLNLELGMPFDFFGLGQPVNGVAEQDDLDLNQNQQGWEPWPAHFREMNSKCRRDRISLI